MSPGRKLRQLFASPGAFMMPGAPTALIARIIEEAGFKAALFTGAGFANLEFAVPDLGLTTMSEVVQQVGRITEAVTIPVVADADTGYGNALNVRRAVRELERAGAAAIQLEDQPWPKRCGHFDGKAVVSREEMIARVKAAVDARRDPETVILARTDARGVVDIHEAIARARAYAEAGADATFVEAPQTVEELALIPKSVSVPQMVNLVEGGKTPILPKAQLEAMGFKLIAYANTALRGAIKGMQVVLAGLARDGTSQAVLDQMVTWEERQRLVGLPEHQALEQRYAVIETTRRR